MNISKRHFLVCPFLFATYPMLFLYAHNMEWVQPVDLVKPFMISMMLAIIVVLTAWLLVRDRIKTEIMASVVLIVFFYYGHLYTILRGKAVVGFVLGRTIVLYPLFCLFLLIAVVLVVRTKKDLSSISRFLMVMSIIIVIMPLIQITAYYMGSNRQGAQKWKSYVDRSCRQDALRPDPRKTLPDVYYIILDNYSRADLLKDDLGYDNSKFIDFLTRKGFYVASKSNSNYLGTVNSLPSSLNFNSLTTLGEESGYVIAMNSSRLDRIRYCKVAVLLRQAGYRFVTFPSGFSVTGYFNADKVYKRSFWDVTEFDRVFLNSTMLMAPFAIVPEKIFESVGQLADYRRDILYTFDSIKQVPEIKEPTFAFMHIMVAHPPFVFDADGNVPKMSFEKMMSVNKFQPFPLKTYTDAITFTNKKMEDVITTILAKSTTPPIIIVQGDHGISHKVEGIGTSGNGLLDKKRMHAILNAYYLPDGGKKYLYPTISPVNSFRLIFNHYFGMHYKMMPDSIYPQ